MEEHRTFSIKSRKNQFSWFFRYNLDGTLFSFTVLKGVLTKKQSIWLFVGGRFPVHINDIDIFKNNWNKYFIVEETAPEMNFAYMWSIYKKPAFKKAALEFWEKKMKEEDRVLAILGFKKYKEYCEEKRQDKQDLIRYLKNRRYEDFQ